jgi:hypothetical protein
VAAAAVLRRWSHRDAVRRRPVKMVSRRTEVHICRPPGECQPVQRVDIAHRAAPAA